MHPNLLDELRKERYLQILREVEAYQLATNLAFSHPDGCRSIADKIWDGLSNLTILSLKVTRRYTVARRL